MRNKLQKILTAIVLAIFVASCGSNVKVKKNKSKGFVIQNNNPTVSFAEKGVSVPTEELKAITSNNNASLMFFFDFNDYSIKYDQLSDLSLHAKFLKENPNYRLVLEGHTDQRGTTEYNLALGQKRSNSIKEHLQNLGIEKYRLEAISYGKERPLINQFDEYAFSQNRRVELRYVSVGNN